MKRTPDFLTSDLFSVPQPADLTSPQIDLKVRIASEMARAMKGCEHDRYEVAMRMSRILGRDVTKNMLDAYAANSKDTHVPNLAFCAAFDAATNSHALLNLLAALEGCRVFVGEEALRAELGRLELAEAEIRKQKTKLKKFLGRNL